LDECRSTGGVSIMELDAVERMHTSIAKYSYPLVQIKDVVCTLETPAQKISRIEGLETPAKGFDYPTLLDQIWSRQNDEAVDDLVHGATVIRATVQDTHIEHPGLVAGDAGDRLAQARGQLKTATRAGT